MVYKMEKKQGNCVYVCVNWSRNRTWRGMVLWSLFLLSLFLQAQWCNLFKWVNTPTGFSGHRIWANIWWLMLEQLQVGCLKGERSIHGKTKLKRKLFGGKEGQERRICYPGQSGYCDVLKAVFLSRCTIKVTSSKHYNILPSSFSGYRAGNSLLYVSSELTHWCLRTLRRDCFIHTVWGHFSPRCDRFSADH